jgi:hypothetical protein
MMLHVALIRTLFRHFFANHHLQVAQDTAFPP